MGLNQAIRSVDRHGRQGHRSVVPIGLDDLVEEAFLLIAEDLRLARGGTWHYTDSGGTTCRI